MSLKVLVAYGILALVIFGVVAGGVHASVVYVRNNTIAIGELTTVVDHVDLGNAQNVQAVIEMGLGELSVNGGAQSLLEAKYTTNVTPSLPISTYSVAEEAGLLQVHHSKDSENLKDLPDLSRFEEYESQWNLAFNGNVPLDLVLKLGKGTGDIDLRDLYLTALMVEVGQGAAIVDLRGERRERIEIQVEVGQGDATVDLRGEWHENASADISAGLGHVLVLLPSDTGVVVHAERGLSAINTEGLTKNGDQYVNDAYGESDVTLKVEVSVGMGAADLTVSE